MRTDTTRRTSAERCAAASPSQHRHQRDDAGTAADEQHRGVAVPDEPAADRAADLELVADDARSSCRNVETSPSSRRSTVSSISLGVVGRRGDRVRPRPRCTVGCREPDDEVLAGHVMASGRSRREPEGLGARRLGRDARRRCRGLPRRGGRVGRSCISHLGSAVRATGRRGRGSRCCSQKPGSSWSSSSSPATHLALFQKYRCGTSRRAGPPWSRCERLAVDIPDDPRLAAGHIGEREVGRVTGVRVGKHVGRGRQRARATARSVSTETPANVMPSFDHVVTQWMSPVVGRRRKGVDLLPRPRRRALDEPVDGERPAVGRQVRRRLGGEDGPVASGVVLAGRKARVALRRTSSSESSCEEGHQPNVRNSRGGSRY